MTWSFEWAGRLIILLQGPLRRLIALGIGGEEELNIFEALLSDFLWTPAFTFSGIYEPIWHAVCVCHYL